MHSERNSPKVRGAPQKLPLKTPLNYKEVKVAI
jgi:hypothetical protein